MLLNVVRMNKKNLFQPLILPYIQKRNICEPLCIIGGGVYALCYTQRWNPYFPRGEWYALTYFATASVITGLVI